jgi:hypothetical protein
VRTLQPLLPALVQYVEADYERWSTLLEQAAVATNGQQFTIAKTRHIPASIRARTSDESATA